MINLKKTIFITGVTGFVGASLLHRLILLGANNIHVLIRKDSNVSRIENILNRVTVHLFSLENREETLAYIKNIKPQIIFHVAAMGTSIGRVPVSIDELIKINTLGSIHLMDAAVAIGCEYFVNTGSSSEYGKKDVPMSEMDIVIPNNPYGISKAASTQYASFLKKNYSFPIVTYRLFSVYGELEDSKRLIPTLIQNYAQGEVPQLASPFPVRDFIYIDDVIDSYLKVDSICNTPTDIVNIGTGIQSSIKEVVDILKKISGSIIDPVYGQKQLNQIEPKFWIADNSKMKTMLNISPISLQNGLAYMFKKIIKNNI